jgi:hypothetical protein
MSQASESNDGSPYTSLDQFIAAQFAIGKIGSGPAAQSTKLARNRLFKTVCTTVQSYITRMLQLKCSSSPFFIGPAMVTSILLSESILRIVLDESELKLVDATLDELDNLIKGLGGVSDSGVGTLR